MIQGRILNQILAYSIQKSAKSTTTFLCLLFSIQTLASESALKSLADHYEKTQQQREQLRSLSLNVVERFAEDKADDKAECVETKTTNNSARFVTTFDSKGNACAIYDLSFPTLASFFGSRSLTSIPVQKFKPADYWNWLNGRYDKVLPKFDSFKGQPEQASLQQFWQDPEISEGQPMALTQTALAEEFYLSELVPVGSFNWSPKQKNFLQRVRRRARGQIDPLTDQAINNPQTLLNKIKLKWDAGRKVYDVFMDFDFLPLKGPVALVDFNQHYKLPLNSIIRNVTSYALFNLAEFIPRRIVKRIVQVAIEDAFDAVDQLYSYQLVKLEETLSANISGKMKTNIPGQNLDRALNLVYAQKGDALTQFLVASIQGQGVSLDDLEYIGQQTRHTQEKMRHSNKLQLHSRLVQEDLCDTEIILDNYAVCHKDGERKAIYSLMSTMSIGPIDLGPTMVHDYSFPGRMAAQRSISWILSAAIRIWSPLGRSISFTIGDVFKNFSSVGLEDESVFLQRIENGELDPRFVNPFISNELNWVSIQNLNPFIPISTTATQRIINYNQNQLSQRIQANLAGSDKE